MRFKLVSVSASNANTTLLKLRTATGGSVFGLQLSSSRLLAARNDTKSTPLSSTTNAVSVSDWHFVEVHLVIAGAKHEILKESDGVRAQFWRAFDDFIP